VSAVLEGRRGIVTGGAQGIGSEIVRALLAAGARVAIVDLDEAAAGATARELGDGENTIAIGADVSDEAAVTAAVDDVAARLGGLEFLVNNAGIRRVASFMDYPLEDWNRTLDVDLTGPFLCSRAAIRHMLPAGGGRIVNIASIAGELALKNRVAYNVAKAGLIMLTKTIAFELGDRGIVCNAVAPGVIETPLTREYFQDPAMRRTIVGNTPLGRWGQPGDIADPVVFLCSDAARFIQGTTLFVDGGWVSSKGY
jgi:gluconate 5-dehydrogenase